MADIRSILRLALASSVILSGSLRAQQVADPANLTGEYVAPQALADTLPINHGAAALQQMLLKLRTRASMMLIVAHPDDEDGGLLTYESRGQGARVAMLTLTRGEGGQNLMSADFDDALGLIRTQELLAADRYMGVDQFFGSVVDFGFSKTKEETLANWTHDRVLYDAVRSVRLYRPLIVAAVFVGGPTDGHGHHQVSGEIAQEVFLAAADPKVFPEMGLPVWAPLKVYARAPFARIDAAGMYDYATGKYSPARFFNYVTQVWSDAPPKANVVIHEGEVGERLGMDGLSYLQFARKGLALQKSQNGGASRGPGSGVFDSGYARYGSRLPDSPATEATLFDGIDTSLLGIATLAPDVPEGLRQPLMSSLTEIDKMVAAAATVFTAEHPEATVEPLHAALSQLDTLLAAVEGSSLDATEKFNLLHELRIKRVQLNRALTLALGITVDAVLGASTPADLVPGHPFTAEVKLTAAMPLQVVSATLQVAGRDRPSTVPAQPVATPTMLSPQSPLTLTFQDRLPANTPVTRPAFSRPGIEQPFYNTPVSSLRNAPAAPAPLVAVVRLRHENGLTVEVQAEVRAPNVEGAGVPQAAAIVPALAVSISPVAGIVSLMPGSFTLSASARADAPRTNATLKLALPAAWKSEAKGAALSLEHSGDHAVVPFTVNPARVEPNARYTLTAVGDSAAGQFSESFRPVGYPGLTYTNLYTPATYRAAAVDVATAPGLKIGYLPGTGDSVTDFLPNLGVTPTLLKMADMTPQTLAKFDAVLLGVRAYAAHPELAGAGSGPLLDYARQGGIVIVQYNTARYGDAEAPFAIAVPGDPAHNVVVEAQPVQVLLPDAPLLTWPNKITRDDFSNWVSEFGHGFAASWAPQYTPLLEVHDPDQDPQKGGLLVAPTGRGVYIYCALAIYRQLPEGVPGAYRLMANLLSYAKNPKR